MLKHVKALAIKIVSIFIILLAILGGIYGLSTGDILFITIVFGLIEYIVGDLILLRYTNNTIGTIGDFGLALIIIWFMAGKMTTINNLFTATFIASIGVAIFEYFFHKYVYRNVYNHIYHNQRKSPGSPLYQTEASEELTEVNRKED